MKFLSKLLKRTKVAVKAPVIQVRIVAACELASDSRFEERLCYLVEHATKSRAAFARAIGIGDTTMKTYMAGNTEPRVTELIAISKLTGVNIEWLVNGTGAMRGTA